MYCLLCQFNSFMWPKCNMLYSYGHVKGDVAHEWFDNSTYDVWTCLGGPPWKLELHKCQEAFPRLCINSRGDGLAFHISQWNLGSVRVGSGTPIQVHGIGLFVLNYFILCVGRECWSAYFQTHGPHNNMVPSPTWGLGSQLYK